LENDQTKKEEQATVSDQESKKFSEKLLFPKEFLLLLIAFPICTFFLQDDLKVWFQQPDVMDLDYNYLGGVAMVDPESPYVFEGPWVQSGTRALKTVEGELRDMSISLNLDSSQYNQLDITIASARESNWSLTVIQENEQEVTRNFYSGENGLKNDETRTFQFAKFENSSSSESLTLKFRPIERGMEEDPLLRRIEVVAGYKSPDGMMSLPDYFAFSIFPFLTALFSFYFIRHDRTRGMVMGGMIIVIYIIAFYALDIDIQHFWYLATALLLFTCIRMFWFYARAEKVSPVYKSHAGDIAFWLIAGLIMMFAMQTRWTFFEDYYYRALGSDARGYVEIASKGGPLFATDQSFAPWVREPLFPWILRAWFDIFQFPATWNSARIASFILSLGVCLLAGFLGRKLFGPLVGLGGMLMLALVPEWAFMAVRVLRHDLVLALILAGFWIRLDLSEKLYARAVAYGFWSTALFLLQFSLGIISVPILIWEMIRTKWKWQELIIPALIMATLITPHLLFNYNYNDSKDPLYSSSIHTLYYLNKEKIGEEGFPKNLIEFEENPYVGEPVSSLEFFFKYHSIPEVAYGFTKGYFNIFVWIQPRIFIFRGIELLMLPGLIGGFYFLFSGRWWVAVYFVAAMLPFAFLSYLGADKRLGMEAMLFSAWIWTYGIQELLAELRRRQLEQTK